MPEKHAPQETVDTASNDALDAAMSIAFGSNAVTDEIGKGGTSTIIGRYKLLEKIGEGGFGVVYMAEQQEPIRRRVAVKIIKLGMDTKEVVARFEAERQALAMMDHENIAGVLDAGATDTGRPYFVMELVRGVAITEYCDRNKLNTQQRLKLFVSVCKAVQHAHQKGIIHRDIKPNNVMVTLRDGEPIPKVIDFGVAKATQARLTEKTVFTRYGQFIGTPAYMSPEQIEMSEFDVDTRSDIYSLGVLLYELLTGSTPVEHETLRRAAYSDMQRMICEQEPPKPSLRLSHSGEALATISAQRSTEPKKLGQIVRGELDWIVMKTLEKDRARRYETANGLVTDILRYLHDEPVLAGPPSAKYKLQKFVRRNKKLLGTAAAFALLLVLGTAFSVWQAIRAYDAEELAQNDRDDATDARDRLLDEQKRAAAAGRQRQLERVEALLTTASDSVPVLIQEMRVSRDSVLPLIRSRFEKASRLEDRMRLAIAQTLLDDPQLKFLADGVPNARPGECANLLKAFRAHREAALPLLQQRWDSADNQQSRFRFAVLLLELNKPEAAAQILKLKPDPSTRTHFIHAFENWHGDLSTVAQTLRRHQQGTLQSGLAMALGRLNPATISAAARESIQAALREAYLNAESGGVHSANGWALRRWKATLPPIKASVERSKKRWFVGAAGQTMVVLGNKIPDAPRDAGRYPWPFAISDRETSVAMYRRFLSDPDCPPELKPQNKPEIDPQLVPSDDCPIHRLNLTEIMLFCNWLSRAENRQICYEQDAAGKWWCRFDRNGYRLPSLDEWDFACYAGSTSKFPFGNDEFLLPEYGNLLLRRTQPGTRLMPNDLGMFDMFGNLWELCHTYGVFDVGTNPRRVSERRMLTIRGATFGTGSYYLNRNTRFAFSKERSTDTGFRVVCRIPPPNSDGMRLTEQGAAAWLAWAIAADPRNVQNRLRRIQLYAEYRKWNTIAGDYQKLMELQPDDESHWLSAATIFLQLGKSDEYRRHCAEMLKRFGATDKPLVAERTARACLLLAGTPGDQAAVAKLLDKATSKTTHPRIRAYADVAKGLADFRAGRPGDAIKRLEGNRTAIKPDQTFLPEFNLTVLAMAYHAAGRHNDAKELLGEVGAKIDAALKTKSRVKVLYWRDFLIVQFLHREAKALIDARKDK